MLSFFKGLLVCFVLLAGFAIPAKAQNALFLKFNPGDCINCNSVVSVLMHRLPASDSLITIVVEEVQSKAFIDRYIEEFIDLESYKLIRSNDFYRKLNVRTGSEICVWNEKEQRLLFSCEAKNLSRHIEEIDAFLSVIPKN